MRTFVTNWIVWWNWPYLHVIQWKNEQRRELKKSYWFTYLNRTAPLVMMHIILYACVFVSLSTFSPLLHSFPFSIFISLFRLKHPAETHGVCLRTIYTYMYIYATWKWLQTVIRAQSLWSVCVRCYFRRIARIIRYVFRKSQSKNILVENYGQKKKTLAKTGLYRNILNGKLCCFSTKTGLMYGWRACG